jgi:hypothetical protein
MSRTARQLVIDAYQTATIVPINDTPTGNELERGIKELNGIINMLNNRELWPYTNLIVNHTFPTGQDEFTIGVDNGVDPVDIDAQRPNHISQIRILIGNMWYPLNQDVPATFDSRTILENVSSIPRKLFPLWCDSVFREVCNVL